MVAEGENRTMKGWLLYGQALLEGRKLFASNERFGQWLVSSNLDQTIHPGDRQAAMWAAAHPDQYGQMRKAHPRVRTVRGLHAKFKNPEKAPKETASHAELTMMRKLKAQADHPTTDPNVASACRSEPLRVHLKSVCVIASRITR